MNDKRKKAPGLWLTAGLFSLALLLCYFGFQKVQFISNDDFGVIRLLEGWFGSYPDFNLFIHGALVWVITSLSKLFPSGHIYAWFYIVSMWLTLTVIAKSAMVLMRKAGRSPVIGLIFTACVYMLIYAWPFCAYTLLSVYYICAAVMQIMSLCGERDGKKLLRGMALGLFLAAMAYFIRLQMLWSTLAACGLAVLGLLVTLPKDDDGKPDKRVFRCVMLCAAGCIAVMGILFGWRLLELNTGDNSEMARFNDARTVINDYHQDIEILEKEHLKELGWKYSFINIVNDYNMLDHRFNEQTFERAIEISRSLYTMPLRDKIHWTWVALKNSIFSSAVSLALIPLLIFGILLMFRSSWKHRLWVLLVIGAAAAQYIAICWLGRPFVHVVSGAFLPAMCLMSAMAATHLPALFGPSRHTAAGKRIIALLCAVTAAGCVLVTKDEGPLTFSLADEYSQDSVQTQLDEYALAHPDTLFLCDFYAETRMFPDTSNGKPSNLLFSVGWPSIGSTYRKALERFGIAWEDVDGTMYLRDNVRLITTGDYNLEHLIPYIRSHYKKGTKIEYEVEASFGDAMVLRLYAVKAE